jgi:hypothetical protein
MGLALLTLAVAAGFAPSGGDLEQRIIATLQRREADSRSPDELASELARLGPEAIPVWRRWLVGAGLEEIFFERGVHRPEDWVITPDAAPALALSTLAVLPSAAVVREFERALRSEDTRPDEYLAAFRTVEALGSAEGLTLALGLADRLGSDATEVPRFRDALVAALASILARDEAAPLEVGRRLEDPDPLEIELFLAAFLAADEPALHAEALQLLGRELASPERFAALRVVAQLERNHPWQLEPRLVETLEREWDRLAEDERHAALALYGASEDPAAFEPLLELVQQPDPRLWRGARAALVELTGVDHERDEEAWSRWYERELTWAREDLTPTLAALSGPGVAAALAELAGHPFFRRMIARGVSSRLAQADERTCALGAVFLSGLPTRAGWPAAYAHAQRSGNTALAARLGAILEPRSERAGFAAR